MRYKLLTLAVIAGFLIAAVPALAQDDTSTYPTTTPTVTTPTTPADTTDTADAAPSDDSGTAGTGSGEELAQTGGGDSWKLLAIGGILAVGSALLLVRRPRRNQ